ncbi:ATP-binding protein [Streptomyces sp. NPDC004838]
MTAEDRLRPGQVRRSGRAHLVRWGLAACGDAVDLCLSELVANAVEHGQGDIGVRMWRTSSQLHIEVISDGACAQPCPGSADPTEESGRGLLLVAAYADSWGIAADGSRTRAWCALGIDRSGK